MTAGRYVRVLLVLAVLTVPAAASAAPFWGQGTGYGATTSTFPIYASIACSGAGTCVTVGSTQPGGGSGQLPRGQILASSAGTWGVVQPVTTLPADAATGADASSTLMAVACTTATSCDAVGSYVTTSGGRRGLVIPVTLTGASAILGTPLAFTGPADSPTAAKDVDEQLLGVSCRTGDCTAVGSYADDAGDQQALTATSGSWTGTKVTAPMAAADSITLNAVSCPTTGACQAVGNYENGPGHNVPWTTQLTGVSATDTVDVPMPADAKPRAQFYAGVTLNALTAVSCASAGACTAAGSYAVGPDTERPVAVPIVTGQPDAPVALDVPDGDLRSAVTGIWCSTASDCTVDGFGTNTSTAREEPLVGSESGTGWTALTPITVDTGALGFLFSLGCSAPGVCTGAGAAGVTGAVRTFFANSAPTQLTVTTASIPPATAGQPYSATLHPSGGSGTPATWSVTSGSLPAGLALDAGTGAVSGTPTAAGQSGFVATATDPGPPNQTATANLSITVAPAPPVVTPTPTPSPAPTGTVTIAHVSARGSQVTVVLLCTGAPCAGTLRLRGSVRRRHKKTRTSTLAAARYAIQAEASQTARLTLSSKALKLVAHLRKHKARVAATPTGMTTPAVTRSVTLKSPVRRRHKK